jgi:hypothetical protein
MTKKIFGAVLMVAALTTFVPIASAEPTPGNVQVTSQGGTPGNIQVTPSQGTTVTARIDNPIKANNFSEFASMVTKSAVQILLPFVVLAFMYSGFLFIKAQGNEKELEEAKKAIWYSMIGAFILLGAWSFAQIIGRTVSTLTQ